MEKHALISVYNKTGIVDFAHFLNKKGFAILSTGGTYRLLIDSGIDAHEVSEYTGMKELLDGRVKTLHPKIHAGLLSLRNDSNHQKEMSDHNIDLIDVLVVNLYPFFEKSSENLTMDELVEFIDIGGPAMIRAAAKNHSHVTVVSDPEDYPLLMEEWDSGGISAKTRRRLAAKVFSLTGAYDSAIAHCLLQDDEMPHWLSCSYIKVKELRYGENPHQNAAWYVPTLKTAYGALSDLVQHQGKELSFNNLQDLDAAWKTVCDFDSSACAAVKHAAPCAVALASETQNAWLKSQAGDPVSVFGGVIAFNREVDKVTADLLGKVFLEVIAAPSFTSAALESFKAQKNLRIVTVRRSASDPWDVIHLDGGICYQSTDRDFIPQDEWTIVTKTQPNDKQMRDLDFAWKVVKHVKSNAIVLAADSATLGIGCGQPNRVGAVRIAISAALERSRGSVMASDAFFPFDDAVRIAIDAGVKAIIQPGGSIRDADSIKACDEAGIPMIFTGRRHFLH